MMKNCRSLASSTKNIKAISLTWAFLRYFLSFGHKNPQLKKMLFLVVEKQLYLYCSFCILEWYNVKCTPAPCPGTERVKMTKYYFWNPRSLKILRHVLLLSKLSIIGSPCLYQIVFTRMNPM